MRPAAPFTAYTIWTGTDAIGAFAVGVVMLGEQASVMRIVAAAPIASGMALIKLSTTYSPASTVDYLPHFVSRTPAPDMCAFHPSWTLRRTGPKDRFGCNGEFFSTCRDFGLAMQADLGFGSETCHERNCFGLVLRDHGRAGSPIVSRQLLWL